MRCCVSRLENENIGGAVFTCSGSLFQYSGPVSVKKTRYEGHFFIHCSTHQAELHSVAETPLAVRYSLTEKNQIAKQLPQNNH